MTTEKVSTKSNIEKCLKTASSFCNVFLKSRYKVEICLTKSVVSLTTKFMLRMFQISSSSWASVLGNVSQVGKSCLINLCKVVSRLILIWSPSGKDAWPAPRRKFLIAWYSAGRWRFGVPGRRGDEANEARIARLRLVLDGSVSSSE